MPYAAKRPCTVCGKLGQCPEHTRQARRREREREQPTRPSASARGYGARWRATRAGFLAKHPYCVLCEQAGQIVKATIVDHIIPHRGDSDLFWDRENWRSLCKRCHDIKTADEDSFRGPDGKWGSAKQASTHPQPEKTDGFTF